MNVFFKRILIAVDLSRYDDKLFAYTQSLINKVGANKVYLLHVIPNFLLPENPDLSFHKLFSSDYSVDEKVRDLLKEKAAQYFDPEQVDVQINVVEGAPYRQLLHWAEHKEIDLIVVGKKYSSEGSGITAKRLVRKAKASVLFVPNNARVAFNSMLIPVDYSNHSAKALRLGIQFKNQSENGFNIEALHVTQVLPMDNYYGLSANQTYVDTLVENSKKSFDQFILKESFDESLFKKEIIPVRFNNVGQDIQSFAKQHDLDLILIGAQGHTAFDRIVFGSVTEQLVNLPVEVPVLVLR